jgi:hypothetical protein
VTALFLLHLPRVLAGARFAARRLRCPHDRADLEAEVVALAWRWFAALARRGRQPEAFVSTLVQRCGQAARAGRQVAGAAPARDALSPAARARRGARLERLGGAGEPLAEALAGHTRSPVPDQVQFRVDFPRWRARLSPRNRAVADALMAGETTGAAAARFGLSPARISQLRAAFAESWADFTAG